MNEAPTYDPKVKMAIKDTLYKHLYTPTERHYQKRLDALIAQNSSIYGNTQRRMLFRDDVYEASNPGRYVTPINFTHPDMTHAMLEYVNDLDKLNHIEMPYVMGFINRVLNSSNSLTDYFRIFPESVHQPIQTLVDQCAYRAEELTDAVIERLVTQNERSIELMKTRMVKNLLL